MSINGDFSTIDAYLTRILQVLLFCVSFSFKWCMSLKFQKSSQMNVFETIHSSYTPLLFPGDREVSAN